MEGTGYFETSVRTSDRTGNTHHCENAALHTRRGLTAAARHCPQRRQQYGLCRRLKVAAGSQILNSKNTDVMQNCDYRRILDVPPVCFGTDQRVTGSVGSSVNTSKIISNLGI